MREMDKLMSQWDVFVSPAPGSASLLVTNLTGHPAVCVALRIHQRPAASRSCSPVGCTTKASPLRVALAFERATKWHTMHPKMDWA